jgi:hypothetical protein
MRDGWHPTALQKTLIDELISRSAMVEISTPAAVESVST